ncbi:MAG: nuclear transport factor 2 family protein, partial [Leptolyngbya sp. SIO1D8]|nr:nuclear transport factor 2 family protein [Leptolyngbya sp. SIO1D8]
MFRCDKSIIAALFIGTVLSGMYSQGVSAAPAETAPEALVSTLEAIEAAANTQDLEQVMALHSADFQGADGFTWADYQETLSQFWEQYSTLTYDVNLLSWEADGEAFLVET